MECTANQQGQSTAPGSCLCSDAEMNPFCKALSEHTRCRLCQASRQLLIKCGATVAAAECSSELLIVKTGVIASVLLTENGRTHGCFLGYRGYLANIVRAAGSAERYEVGFTDSHFGYAFTDARLCAVRFKTVRECFREDPDFAWRMFSELTDRSRDFLKSLSLISEMSGAEKVAWLLDELEGAGVDLTTVTHETIGRVLNMNRVNVSRVMASALGPGTRRDRREAGRAA